MNITIIADVYGQGNNGTSITARRLVENMTKRGHNVNVVSTYQGDNEHYFKVDRRKFGIFDYYITVKNGVTMGKPEKTVIWNAIKDADVVHFLLPFKMSKCGLKMCIEHNIPFTTAFHFPPEMVSDQLGLVGFKPLNKLLYDYFNKSFYKKTTFCHCPSKMVADKLEKYHYKTKNYVISNGVLPDFTPNRQEKSEELKGKFCILTIGRLSGEKCQSLIIDAVKKSKHKDNIQLIIAGNGPLENKLKKRAKGLPIQPIIKFFTKEELLKTINMCDLYIHASKMETEGMGCLEALSCGLVPILSDSKNAAVGQFALDERNLFKFPKSKDLANKIDYWYENLKEREISRENYCNYMQKYQIDKCMDEMEQMFYDAIEYTKNKKANNE